MIVSTVTDLSQVQGIVGNLFVEAAAQPRERYRLTDEQVGFFEENGSLSGV